MNFGHGRKTWAMNNIDRLVTNGCSFMAYHASGDGHKDLAESLDISSYSSLAENSVCNSRILRTTLRDMYSTDARTLYVIGITFVHRYELTVLNTSGVDGRWKSFNGLHNSMHSSYHDNVVLTDLDRFSKAWNNIIYDVDLFEDLIFRLLSLIDAAKHIGHKILVFNTAEHLVDHLDYSQFENLDRKEIVDRLFWRSIPWQFEQGAAWPQEDEIYPANCRHVRPGDHKWLNEFLINYINQHNIL